MRTARSFPWILVLLVAAACSPDRAPPSGLPAGSVDGEAAGVRAETELRRPVLVVLGNGIPLAGGDAPPELMNHTNFSSVYENHVPPARTFTIRNDGDGPLVVDAVGVSAGFRVTNPPEAIVAPGQSTTFNVQIDTATVGTFDATVRIASNGGVYDPFTFAIRGFVLPAPLPAVSAAEFPASIGEGPSVPPPPDGVSSEVESEPAPVLVVRGGVFDVFSGSSVPRLANLTDFGRISQNTAMERTFTIRNIGDAPILLDQVEIPSGFLLTGAPEQALAPGAMTTLRIRLDTAAPGLRRGNVQLGSSAGADAFTFLIQGEVLAPRQVFLLRGDGIGIAAGTSAEIELGRKRVDTANGTYFYNPAINSSAFLFLEDEGWFREQMRFLVVAEYAIAPPWLPVGAQLTNTFSIQNRSTAPVTIDEIRPPHGFVLVDPPPNPLPPGVSAFRIRIDTATPGIKYGEVRIRFAGHEVSFWVAGLVVGQDAFGRPYVP